MKCRITSLTTNAQYESGDHEVHETPQYYFSSPRYPAPQNQEGLGYHLSCHGAVAEAIRKGYKTTNGCPISELAGLQLTPSLQKPRPIPPPTQGVLPLKGVDKAAPTHWSALLGAPHSARTGRR